MTFQNKCTFPFSFKKYTEKKKKNLNKTLTHFNHHNSKFNQPCPVKWNEAWIESCVRLSHLRRHDSVNVRLWADADLWVTDQPGCIGFLKVLVLDVWCQRGRQGEVHFCASPHTVCCLATHTCKRVPVRGSITRIFLSLHEVANLLPSVLKDMDKTTSECTLMDRTGFLITCSGTSSLHIKTYTSTHK